MSNKKNAKPATPPTVLVITLEADGNGSLLARRGELAHLSQFTYEGLPDIVTAIQQGATELIAIEQNPPNVDGPTPAGTPVSEADATPPSEADATAPAPPDSESSPSTTQTAEAIYSVLPANPTVSQAQLM